MTTRKQRWLITMAVLAAVLLVTPMAVTALPNLGGVLKGAGIGLLVQKFGPDINKAINSLTGNKDVPNEQATKVVPILSVGNGAYLGAAQVSGPEANVAQVQAVAQLEGNFNAIGGVRLRALVPISSKSVQNIKRVNGVGVSALVDFKL